MRRKLEPEMMDAPTLEADLHMQALAGLRRINRVSGVASQLVKPVIAFAGKKRVTMLDVASGGGDVPVNVAIAARAAGASIELTLFDRSEVALQRAIHTAENAGLSVRSISGDAVEGPLPGQFDIVTCSLFLHHLDDRQTVAVLNNLRSATRGLLLVSDLRRCVSGFVAAHVGCRLLSRSPVVHFDGPVSAHAAWTVAELQSMAARAGMRDAVVRRASPFRMLLRWEAGNHAN